MRGEIVERVWGRRMGMSISKKELRDRYGGIRSKHPTLAARAALDAARRVSTADGPDDGEDEEEQSRPLNFAQKLLLGRPIFRIR